MHDNIKFMAQKTNLLNNFYVNFHSSYVPIMTSLIIIRISNLILAALLKLKSQFIQNFASSVFVFFLFATTKGAYKNYLRLLDLLNISIKP